MKSKVGKVAELAMKLGARHLADYGHVKSRHDFTQRQLMCCLNLRAYLKATYRGVIDLLEGHTALREVLGMEQKLPHYTTLQKFRARQEVQAVADAMIAQIGAAALQAAGPKTAIAMDVTGLETSNASAHFTSRAGRVRRKWQKLSLTVVCGALLPLGLLLDWGSGNDKYQAFERIQKSFDAAEDGGRLPHKLYADADYDADWVHGVCREVWGVKSFSKPACRKADGSLGGQWRSGMSPDTLQKAGYGKRWHIESFFIGLKRMTGSALTSRTDGNLAKEAILRVLGYTLHC